MIQFPSARRVCVVLCLLAYPLLGSAAGANLTRVLSDPDADPPSLLLEFSGDPDWTQTLGMRGSEQELRIEFADMANTATQNGYRRAFQGALGFAWSLSIDEEPDGNTSNLVVALTFPLASAATVDASTTPGALTVTMAPAAVGAAASALPVAGPSEATQSSVKTLYIVGGLILLLGTGAVAGYFLLQSSGRNKVRAVAVPAEEAKELMREDVDAFREAADAELDASHERHQRLTRIVRQDMSEIRLEMSPSQANSSGRHRACCSSVSRSLRRRTTRRQNSARLRLLRSWQGPCPSGRTRRRPPRASRRRMSKRSHPMPARASSCRAVET